MTTLRLTILALVSCHSYPSDDSAHCSPADAITISPTDGATDIDLDAPLSIAFDIAVDDASLWVDGGMTETWQSLGSGASFEWVPSDLMAYETTYTAVVSTCGVELGRSSFTTQERPVEVDLVGMTFVADFTGDDATWIHPNQAAADLFLEDAASVLMMLSQREGATATALVGIGQESGDEIVQYDCAAPIEVTGVDLSADPLFSFGPVDLVMTVGSNAVALYDVAMSGRFALDGSTVEDFHVTGMIDLRQLANAQLELICGAAETMGTECVLCPDQDKEESPACATIEAIDHDGVYLPGLVIDPGLAIGKGC